MALDYEVEDMQNYVLNGGSEEYLTYSRDVMSVLTDIRKQWGMIYPFEQKIEWEKEQGEGCRKACIPFCIAV